jgi:hypothetical protein
MTYKRKVAQRLIKHHDTKTYGEVEALGRGEWSASRPGRYTPSERATGTHWIGGWVGTDVVWTLWKREIYLSLSGNQTTAVQPVACRYIDWAIPAHFQYPALIQG